MRQRLALAIVAALLAGAAAPAVAQSPYIRVPVGDNVAASNSGGVTYGWAAGAWGLFDSYCSTTAARTRTVECRSMVDGSLQPDDNCTAARPSSVDVQAVYSACTYSWNPGAFTPWADAAGTPTRTRTVTCLRSNGDTVPDASCSGAKPATVETAAWFTDSWSAWSSTCSNAATRTRAVSCRNQTSGATEADSACAVSSAKPPTSDTQGVYSSCSYSWQTGGWADPGASCGTETWTRPVSCLRSTGDVVADANCSGAGAKPATTMVNADYSGCSYSWQVGGWSDPGANCGNETWTRAVWCRRSDGVTVGDASCGGGKPATTTSNYDVSGCGYSGVAGGWSDPGANCGYETWTRYAACRRSDGQDVADSECTNRGIAVPARTYSNYDTSACGYTSGYGGLYSNGSCSGGSRTDTYYRTCTRSDGVAVDAATYCGSSYITQTVSCGPTVQCYTLPNYSCSGPLLAASYGVFGGTGFTSCGENLAGGYHSADSQANPSGSPLFYFDSQPSCCSPYMNGGGFDDDPTGWEVRRAVPSGGSSARVCVVQ